MALPHLNATRYVLPLREGGSLPAIVDTDGPGQYVVKFRGAGQGPKALVAEAIAAGLAGVLGLPVPDAAVIDVAKGFGMGEPDAEIQDLLKWSIGKNFGLRYLSGALGFDPVADRALVDADLAATIVWFDAWMTNVARTARNPNILVWNSGLWLIEPGACLYFHQSSGDWQARAQDRFPLIKDHILHGFAGDLRSADERLQSLLTGQAIRAVIDDVPAEWLGEESDSEKRSYVSYLVDRLNGERPWVWEAESARRG